MEGLTTNNAPSPGVVIPYYAFAAISFLVLTALSALTADSFTGHFFHPHLLSITHIAALGWGSMIIFGALYQLLPVILQVGLYSEKLAKASFFLMATGTITLAASFWFFSVGHWLQLGASLLIAGISLFAINVIATARQQKDWGIETDFIISAVVWLIITAILGLLMAFNFRLVFLPETHIFYLKIHAHTGLAGWFLQLIIGVGSRLLPMFLLSHGLNKKKLQWAYWLINGGLLFLLSHWLFFNNLSFEWVGALLIITGILFFLLFIYEAFKKKIRKPDIGMKQSFAALFLLILPLVLGLIISKQPQINEPFLLRVYMVYGFSAFFGLITALIMGQTLKTLPFIVWLAKYRSLVGKVKLPLPKDLYSEKIAFWQFRFYLSAIFMFITGIFFAQPMLIQTGAFALLTAAVLYNINVFKILFHSAKQAQP
jgi:hypothetical protein